MIRCLKELCYTGKKKAWFFDTQKKKKKLSCWLRLINSSAFQFFMFAVCFGKMGHEEKKHQGKASGTEFSVCFLD